MKTTSKTAAMSLKRVVGDPDQRAIIAADAVAEAAAAVGERTGLAGMAAQLGLDAINRIRPGFLERHMFALLPALVGAIEPHWVEGTTRGDPHDHLVSEAELVSTQLLAVTDEYVDSANDTKAIAVYEQLRHRAPHRIREQMPRIAEFIDRHTPS